MGLRAWNPLIYTAVVPFLFLSSSLSPFLAIVRLFPLSDAFGIPCFGCCFDLHFRGVFGRNMVVHTSLSAWIARVFACMRGCLGSCTKPTPITAVDEPSKGLRIQGRTVKKPSISDDFWSTSTCEIDKSTVQSQRSQSSISTSNQSLPHNSSIGSTSSNSEFINHGLLLWNQTRFQWVGNRRSENQSQQIREPRLRWNATYESLLGTSRPFSQPIPLSEMIGFLVDVWEQEGMYD